MTLVSTARTALCFPGYRRIHVFVRQRGPTVPHGAEDSIDCGFGKGWGCLEQHPVGRVLDCQPGACRPVALVSYCFGQNDLALCRNHCGDPVMRTHIHLLRQDCGKMGLGLAPDKSHLKWRSGATTPKGPIPGLQRSSRSPVASCHDRGAQGRARTCLLQPPPACAALSSRLVAALPRL